MNTHTLMHMRTFMHVCTHASINVCMHAYMHACTHTHTHTRACQHTYMHSCMHARTHACAHAHTHTHTHTLTNTQSNNKWSGELGATMKEVCLESRPWAGCSTGKRWCIWRSAGHSTLFDHPSSWFQIIRECLCNLTPLQSCVTLWSKAYENQGVCTQVDPWFNTCYSLTG